MFSREIMDDRLILTELLYLTVSDGEIFNLDGHIQPQVYRRGALLAFIYCHRWHSPLS
jgi:hypothetical protein